MSFEQERKALEAVVNDLQDNGYTITGAFDSVENMPASKLAQAASKQDIEPILDWVTAADVGSITFQSPENERFTIHMVYGNSPEEVISDMSAKTKAALDKGTALVETQLENFEQSLSSAPGM